MQVALSLQQAKVSEGCPAQSAGRGHKPKALYLQQEYGSNVFLNTPQASPHILSKKESGGEK